jgi:hypothetical protein
MIVAMYAVSRCVAPFVESLIPLTAELFSTGGACEYR